MSNEIDSLANKLKGKWYDKLAFRVCCAKLSLFKEISQSQNVKLEEMNFETIFNHFKEIEKEKLEV
jgi:hypothetical protein